MNLFTELATLAEQLSTEPGRLKKRAAIAELVTHLAQTPEDLAHAVLYLAGQPYPESDPRKLNAGGAILSRAVKEVSQTNDAQLTAAYRKHGDLGAAAFDLLAPPFGKAPTEATLTYATIAAAFNAMATARSTQARFAAIEGLLKQATALEAKYLLKLMLNDMRIGVKQSLIEEAIAVAASADVAAVRHAVMLEADLGRAANMAFAGTLAEARMTLFHPLGFMLASPVETPEEAIDRFTEKPKAEPRPKPKKRKNKATDADPAEAEQESGMDTLPADASEEAYAENIEVYAAKGGVLSTEAIAGSPARLLGAMGCQRSGETPACAMSEEPPASIPPQRATADPQQEPEGDGVSAPGSAPGVPQIHAYLEDKYDGMRAQLHFADPTQPGRVAIYSRNREDITESFPEIEEAFSKITAPPMRVISTEAIAGPPARVLGEMGCKRSGEPPAPAMETAPPSGIILDGEILGWDFTTGKALPFATLGQRIGRKRVDNSIRTQIPVVFMAFDLMFAGGELTLPLPLRQRRARLEALTAELSPLATSPLEKDTHVVPGGLFAAEPTADDQPRLLLSPAVLIDSAEAIDTAYADARARANEGVMLKAAGSAYLPGRRGLAWVKLKRTLDTLDVVITGAEFGSGRRSQFLSDYTFAIRGEDGDLLNVGKAYSGVTDAEIAELTEWCKAHTLEDHGHFRTVEPLRVLEVAFNNIMRSDRHASGFALRFPRIITVRNDKPVNEIDTLARVEEIYQSQPDRPVE